MRTNHAQGLLLKLRREATEQMFVAALPSDLQREKKGTDP